MRVGVEDAVDDHLAQQGVEQRAGARLAVADLLVRVNRAERAAVSGGVRGSAPKNPHQLGSTLCYLRRENRVASRDGVPALGRRPAIGS